MLYIQNSNVIDSEGRLLKKLPCPYYQKLSSLYQWVGLLEGFHAYQFSASVLIYKMMGIVQRSR